MSDEEEEIYGFYGKPLEQYDEDSIPKKRPISVEEQIATDAQGRRRFHGAFTGGFSAGFYNTVGSLEGWKPTEFKSSRLEKAENKTQRPEDFMDDEDVGEFGIAPQTLKATKDYNTSKKRKKKGFSDGPIPGEPVLHTLIESGTETIGYLLLRHMGLKHTPLEEVEDDEEEMDPPEEIHSKKVYGCVMPKPAQIKSTLQKITSTNIPEIYKAALKNPKSNTFGLGYTGLEKTHVNLFTSTNLVVKERSNKKLSIAGQAFGVGAFEEDDDDIYVKEDLSNYDFELTGESKKAVIKDSNNLTLKMFTPSKVPLGLAEIFPPPTIPHSFSGKHKVRKSRFEPVENKEELVRRRNKDADYRARILGEPITPKENSRIQQKESVVTTNIQTEIEITPQEEEPDERVSKFKLEPPGLSGLIFDRFVQASKSEEHTEMLEPVQSTSTTHGTKDMREAAKMKMFGPLTRNSSSWIPNSLLCKRFNVPEPVFSDAELKPRRRTKNLIFENETYTNESETIHKPGLQVRKEAPDNRQEISDTQIEIDVEMIPLPENTKDIEPTVSKSGADGTDIIEINQNTSKPADSIKSLDPTEKLDVSKNVDLFKAVFLDSESEASDHEEEQVDTKREEFERESNIKQQVLSDDLLLPKIKPMKEGILSNVDFITFRKPIKKNTEEKSEDPVEEAPDLYGPKLPEKIVTASISNVYDANNVGDEWVEKDESRRKDHKHRKKSKKEKHKKKHKHKR